MKLSIVPLLLLVGCSVPASQSPQPASAPASPIVATVSTNDFPGSPVPLETIHATNNQRVAHRDYIPYDTNVSAPYQNRDLQRQKLDAFRSMIHTNDARKAAISADRRMLHSLYIQATNGDDHAKMNYHLLRTNEAFMSRLTNSDAR